MNTSQHWQTPENPPAQSEQPLRQSLAAGRAPSFQTLLPSQPLLQTKAESTAFICLPLGFKYSWNFCSMSRLDLYILTALCPLEFSHPCIFLPFFLLNSYSKLISQNPRVLLLQKTETHPSDSWRREGSYRRPHSSLSIYKGAYKKDVETFYQGL